MAEKKKKEKQIDHGKNKLPFEVPTHLNTQKTAAEWWIKHGFEVAVVKATSVFKRVVKFHLFLKGDCENQAFVNDSVITVAHAVAGKRFVVIELEDGTYVPIYNITKARKAKVVA